jgi:hypothetical protein
VIARYRFGRIVVLNHRIKLRLDAPDLGIPLRVSDLFWTLGSRSNEREQIWETVSPRLGFRLAAGEERHWRWSSVMFPVVPELMNTWTRCRTERGVRVRGRRRRFLPRSKRRHGRRWVCVVEASGSCRGVDPLCLRRGSGVKVVLQVEEGR